ncbi:MAG: SDR family oxidoreductase [Gammaproteobacteria bacterium]|nr:SDR family oxidoreductase [Gammaproteobacteria bacterium]
MKTLFLTGGTGEIGAAILEKFKKQNYTVLAPNRLELDLQSSAAVDNYLKELNVTVDSFVHCAGFNTPKPFSELSEDDVRNTFQINAFSFYSLSHHLVKHNLLKNPGSIVAISSIYGDFSRKGRFAYSASKHALNGMVKTLALELGEKNIKVNAVSPGFVDTKMTSKNNSAATIEDFKKRIPLGRLAAVEDIAEVVYFLSANNNYINGQCIIADGGYSVGGFQS